MEFPQLLAALGVGAFLGAIVTQLMISIRERRAQRVAFLKLQLEQFYGPLLASHKEIHARSELRVSLQRALGAPPTYLDARALAEIHDISVDDENQTMRHVLMPRYQQMADLFRDKMWLAEPETREFYSSFIEFVDIWEKVLSRKLPAWAAVNAGHGEAKMAPFYEHLENVHDRLRREIG
ncbi:MULTISPECIES: hypothetical protein [unclassified Bradyrhizobium]|uniref:hypothetical protein n=1 Tax=Bradyrhizobium TaxID=374 RepID=UPI0028E1A5F1|nr:MULTISPECIES: hypothetical protein [unclassified Bradyrhizobium]